jgi:hypothetical protein
MMINRSVHEETRPLFAPALKEFSLPELEHGTTEDFYDEVELFGFPVTMSWFDMLETSFRGEVPAGKLIDHLGRKIRMVGHLVTVKYIKTVKNDWMNFGCFIDAEGSFFDTVHFSKSLKDYPFKGSGTYLILGKVVEEFGFPFG